jgi:pimeloyl-ACP methyl ester carboxylesterase
MFVLMKMNNRIINLHYNNNEFNISLTSRETGRNLIIFIHGLGCSQNNFIDVWNIESLKTYSIITMDLPGFGKSPMVENFSCDLEAHAEICRKVIAQFPHDTIHIVGHSMGGAIGLLLAEMIRDRLSSFVNVEGNLTGYDCNVSRQKASVSFEDFVAKQLPALILTTSLSDEPGRRLWSRYIKMADKKGFYLSSKSLVSWSDSGLLLKKFQKLDCRKVYIYGERNSFLNVLLLLKGIETAYISNSGHFPMNDNPDEFYQFLADFIQS